MRKALILVAVIVVALVALAVFMHLFPFTSSGNGSSGTGIASHGSSPSLSRVLWRGRDDGFCFYVLGDGSGVGVKDGRVVLRVTPGELLEVLGSLGGAMYYFDGRNVLSYFGGELEVELDYGRGGHYFIPADKNELIEKIWSALAGTPLTTLNGTIVSLDGEEITEQLWMKMRDYDVSDPAVKPYIDWLQEALKPEPHKALNVPWYPKYRYWWFNDGIYYWVRLADAVWSQETGKGIPIIKQAGNDTVPCTGYLDESDPNHYKLVPRACFMPPHPRLTKVVRIGLIKLPFGAGLIVTAYQSGDGITVIVHGTIINETEWRELLARTATFSWPGGEKIGRANVSAGWVLWRIDATSYRKGMSYLVLSDGTRVPVRNVVVLLEMPVYWLTFSKYEYDVYWDDVERMYWDVIGHPAIALALHLANPPNTDARSLYQHVVPSMTRAVVLTDVIHPGNHYGGRTGNTPFEIRLIKKGVCDDQSRATAIFASNALGAYTAYIGIDYGPEGHAISVLLYPPSPPAWSIINVKGVGKGIVIVDTARLSPNYINSHIEGVIVEPPLLYVHPLPNGSVDNSSRYIYFYTGVAYAVTSLPDWLQSPWLGYAMEKSGFEKIEAEAWKNIVKYCDRVHDVPPYGGNISSLLVRARTGVEKVFSNPLYTTPPSVALALKKTNIPVVYEAETPPVRQTDIVCNLLVKISLEKTGDRYVGSVVVNGENITVIGTNATYLPSGDLVMQITIYVNGVQAYSGEMKFICGLFGCEAELRVVVYGEKGSYELWISVAGDSNGGGSGSDSGSGNSSGGGNNTSGGSEGSSGEETSTINATIQLLPIYTSEETPWGTMPVFAEFRGTSVVNNTNITVEAFHTGDGYDIYIYVNSGYAYGTYTNLPATIEFTYNNTEYRIEVKPPAPPALNQTIELELVPVDETQVALPNGTVINVTVYMVNQTITINNATLVVFGYISRLGTDLDIYVFGVPQAEYNITIEGLNATTTLDYSGALHTYIHYEAPENQLIPQGIAVKIMIQPLDLILTILLNG